MAALSAPLSLARWDSLCLDISAFELCPGIGVQVALAGEVLSTSGGGAFGAKSRSGPGSESTLRSHVLGQSRVMIPQSGLNFGFRIKVGDRLSELGLNLGFLVKVKSRVLDQGQISSFGSKSGLA
ncbi:hypothetical protein HAX54_001933 [Datura stramonium]|uniref:Uncharacterized protein n=1 Tax=Datura stramonium TaxID=4076 RepID=A0ABS8T336_DATST|nr:hypothetical protein [Datura stramonium]